MLANNLHHLSVGKKQSELVVQNSREVVTVGSVKDSKEELIKRKRHSDSRVTHLTN